MSAPGIFGLANLIASQTIHLQMAIAVMTTRLMIYSVTSQTKGTMAMSTYRSARLKRLRAMYGISLTALLIMLVLALAGSPHV